MSPNHGARGEKLCKQTTPPRHALINSCFPSSLWKKGRKVCKTLWLDTCSLAWLSEPAFPLHDREPIKPANRPADNFKNIVQWAGNRALITQAAQALSRKGNPQKVMNCGGTELLRGLRLLSRNFVQIKFQFPLLGTNVSALKGWKMFLD